ncbi:MAG: hypothetical protein OEO23_09600 [Gemmatimonadota bacterium]|nr:hypothetical protein [Gemmatimonadota bacterium]
MMIEREEVVLQGPDKAKRERWTPTLLAGAVICYGLTGLMGLVMLLEPGLPAVSVAIEPAADASAPSPVPAAWPALQPHPAPAALVEARPRSAPTEDGMRPVDWDAVRAYKTIESMTATSPTLSDVDNTLDRLRRRGEAHPDRPLIRGLYLKGLRVAAYYALDTGDIDRARELRSRFDAYADRFPGDTDVAEEVDLFNAQG